VIGPEGGAWSEGAAGVDVLVMSSSVSSSQRALAGGGEFAGGDPRLEETNTWHG
jgi:hypothetical protein